MQTTKVLAVEAAEVMPRRAVGRFMGSKTARGLANCFRSQRSAGSWRLEEHAATDNTALIPTLIETVSSTGLTKR